MRAFASIVAGVAAAVLLLSPAGWAAECKEQIPAGAAKPVLVEKVPPRAAAGALVELEIAVRHAAGESATLPADLPKLLAGEVRVADSFARGELPKTAPDPADPGHATTLLKVPLVVLSTALERKTFTVPPMRVIVLRKGGGDLSVCTAEHSIEVDQPIANTPDPWPRPNPASLPQKTRDERAEAIATAAAITLTAAVLLAALAVWWSRRPKEAPPPPPPTPSWKLAVEAIARAKRDLASGAIITKVYYDRISDAVRVHLGDRYGFDGLESTTDEILGRLRRLPSPSFPFADVERLLGECDLVKFANLVPTSDEADAAAALAESVVRATAHPLALRPFDPRRMEATS
ncbi:MAG: hypothetical protein HYV09_09240 [Deltaproteobacteria bacterium]|nr:hypothetical protein [Deltaproteobacteria bacterium]